MQTATPTPDSAPERNTRRAFLASVGAAATSALAGCDEFTDSATTLPALTGGWAKIRTDGRVEFILQFDGDIQRYFDLPKIEPEDIVSLAAENEYSLSFRPVRIPGTARIPASNKVEAVVQDLVTVSQWGGERQYAAKKGFHVPDKTFRVERQGQEVAFELPTKDPMYHLLFPSGYRYRLPGAQYNAGYVNPQRPFVGLFHYDGFSTDRTIPAFKHYDPQIAVEARAFDEYRMRMLESVTDLYNFSWYYNKTKQKRVEAVTELIVNIAAEGVESLITAPVSGIAGFALIASDMLSVHGALRNEYDKMGDYLDSLSKLGGAAANNGWMSQLYPRLETLRKRAQRGYLAHNPVWTSALSESAASNRLEEYIDDIQWQIQYISDTLSLRGFAPVPPTGEYWVRLKRSAVRLLREFRRGLTAERDELDRLT